MSFHPSWLVLPFCCSCLGFESTKDTTDSNETDADADVDTDADTDALPVDHVISSLRVATVDQSFDLDADGEADNVAAAFADVLDPLFTDGLASASNVLILQMCGVDSYTMDGTVDFSLFSAADSDGDVMDNFSGAEVFAAGDVLGPDGCATTATTSALDDGTYKVMLGSQQIVVGSDSFTTATGVWIAGTADPSLNSGVLGTAFTVESVSLVAESAGQSEYVDLLADLADIDSDGDSVNDAISFGFTYDAVACQVR